MPVFYRQDLTQKKIPDDSEVTGAFFYSQEREQLMILYR